MKFRKPLWLVSFLIAAIILSACNLGATPAPVEDPAAIQTRAFNDVLTLVASQQTQTAQAAPPTAFPTNALQPTATLGAPPTFASVNGAASITPFAFNTAQPGFTAIASPISTPGGIVTVTTKNGCNDGTYIGETEPYDGAEMWPGEDIVKGWTIFNTGTCTWDEGYAFVYMKEYSDPEFPGYDILIKKDPKDHTLPNHSQTFIIKFKAPKVQGEYMAAWKLRDDGGNYFGPLVYIKVKVLPYSQKP